MNHTCVKYHKLLTTPLHISKIHNHMSHMHPTYTNQYIYFIQYRNNHNIIIKQNVQYYTYRAHYNTLYKPSHYQLPTSPPSHTHIHLTTRIINQLHTTSTHMLDTRQKHTYNIHTHTNTHQHTQHTYTYIYKLLTQHNFGHITCINTIPRITHTNRNSPTPHLEPLSNYNI